MQRMSIWITLLAGVIACGHALAQESQFAYVASANSDELQGFRINPTTGNLTPISGSPFATGGPSSLPSGINIEGDVVGTSSVAGGTSSRAFLYHHGKLIDLNDLTSTALPLLTSARGINDKGQIVVTGLNGALYVLTPICDFPF